jgi:uncharacterized FlgJ-related protein
MKLLISIIPVFVLSIFPNCTNSKDSADSASDMLETEMESNASSEGAVISDTLVYSIPLNYSSMVESADESLKKEISGYKDVLDLFERLNYTPEAWQAGIREIPRVFLTTIGDRWGKTTTKEITVLQKKQLFFRGIAPLILQANELIMKDRKRLKGVMSEFKANNTLDELDQIWIRNLSSLYKVKSSGEEVTGSVMDELWRKVDIVPPSLALGQAAEESGWGTSRFAGAGNAIYGQWTWGSNAMVPEQQRKELGNYGIAAFESIQESVSSYMLNLNTHNAYSDLRNKRAELRANGQKITGAVLAEQLTKYSERGEEYVKGLKSLMEYNRLGPADEAFLSEGPPIYLIPVAE